MDVNIKNECMYKQWLLKKPFQKDYEDKLLNFLDDYIKKLTLPATYKRLSFTIYRDILTFN